MIAVLGLVACGGSSPGDGADAAVARDGAVDRDAGSDAPPGEWTVVADGTGIQRIERYGANLLDGVGGLYLIGSCTGADDPTSNVTSQGSDGATLRAPGSCPGAPFSLTITGTNPILVSATVGPLPVPYATLSLPLDPKREYMTNFQFAGSSYEVGCGTTWSPVAGAGAAFTTIPQPCDIPGAGAVGVARVAPAPTWGEITGPLGALRLTLLSGDAREMQFIRHPGTHNIEPIFVGATTGGPLAAGTVVHLEARIDLAAPAVVPPTTIHEALTDLGHNIGRAEADGWSASTALDAPGYLAFGPHVTLSPGTFEVRYRLLVDNNTADNLTVARVEVSDFDASTDLASRDIRRTEFAAAGTFQDFALTFASPAPRHRIEFRTFWTDASYVRQSRVEVHWPR